MGLWDYDGRDMVFSFTSVQEEWYSIHASQKKNEQEVFTRSSLSVQEEWYSTHASQKKDKQGVFTRSSLFRRSGGMVFTHYQEEG
jgi:hypothetical protein